jgi:hypothetical protein
MRFGPRGRHTRQLTIRLVQRGFALGCNFESNRTVSARLDGLIGEDRKRNEFGTGRREMPSCGNRRVKSAVDGKTKNRLKLLILNKLAPQAGFEPATLRWPNIAETPRLRILPGTSSGKHPAERYRPIGIGQSTERLVAADEPDALDGRRRGEQHKKLRGSLQR